MSFLIDIRPAAEADLNDIHERLSAYSEDTGNRTYSLLKDAICSLQEFPRRFALAPESTGATLEVRHLVVGNYRVLYTIIGNVVRVARVVHGAQRSLDPKELF